MMAIFRNSIRTVGVVQYVLRGPDGRIKRMGETRNLVTTNGDEHAARQIYSAPTPTYAMMKLGTAATAPSKTGAGSFIAVGDYIAGSAHDCDASSPKAGLTDNIVHFEHTWGAVDGELLNINRASINNNKTNAGEADGTGTFATALLSPRPVNKGAADTLKVTWLVTFLGA